MLISGVILAFVLGGLNVAAQHLFQVSALHNRHRALCAAEVGISKATYQLEQNPAATGPIVGTLDDTSGYRVPLDNSGHRAVLHSVGQAAGQSQRLKVTLSLDADTYLGISTLGLFDCRRNTFINGIRSLADVRSSRGNTHTQGNMRVDPAYRLSVTGQASYAGTAEGSGQVDGQMLHGGAASNLAFTKASLLPGSYTRFAVPYTGEISQNTRITVPAGGPAAEYTQALHIPEGVTMYVTGDLVLHGGVSGGGNLVVDGTLLTRGSEDLRNDNPKGLVIYAEKDVVIAHPSTHIDSSADDGFTGRISAVGELFADMPEGVPYLLKQRLPPGAPSNVNFFSWYATQEASASAAFREWRDGDDSNRTLNPGLPPEVKTWLTRAAGMHAQIESTVTP